MQALVCVFVALVLLLLFSLRHSYARSAEPYEPKPPTIFISVASFRDSECSETLKQAFEKARHPERVTIGVCQQNSDDPAERCLAPDWQTRVRTISLPASQAKGPTWARYLITTLLTDEAYFLQTDSHTRFEPDWDVSLIQQHTAAVERSVASGGSTKVVLSTYPKAHDHGEQTAVPVLCKAKWNDDGLPTLDSRYMPPDGRRVPFTSGGMLFAPAAMVREVPYDGALPQLHVGEEILYSARLYTHGWDVYTPTLNVISHHYGRPDAPKNWQERSIDQAVAATERATSVAKVRYMLGLTANPPAFMKDNRTLGSARTIQDFWAFSGLDADSKTSRTAELFCP